MQIHRKQGRYKVYKLPNGAVLLPYSDGLRIKDRLKLESSGSYIDEYFKLKKDEYIVVNCDTQLLYRVSQKELNDIFYVKGLDTHKKCINRAFGYMYLDNESSEYIIDGADAQIQQRHCGLVSAIVYKTKYNKKMVKLECRAKYDLERFYAEFDNRSIPKDLKKDLQGNTDNCIEYIESLLRDKLISNISSVISSIMNEYIDSAYDTSVLKYYSIEKPQVKGNKIIYSLPDINDFSISVKKNRISLYYGKEQVIPFVSFNKFYDTFRIMFALYDAREIYSLMPENISLSGIQLINEYKYSSDRLNKAIKSAYTEDKISENDLELYIKAMYIHKLLNTCRIKKDIWVFRGGIHRDDTLTFKSASFALPAALCHGRTVSDTAALRCVAGTNMMLSNFSGLYQHEAESIIDSGFKLDGSRNKNGLSFLLVSRTDNKIKSDTDNWIAQIAWAITYDDLLSNYVYIYGVSDNTLIINWIYNIGYNMSVQYNNGKYMLNIPNYRGIVKNNHEDILDVLRKYILNEINNGMSYRSNCDLHKMLGMRTQLILLNMGFNVRIQFQSGSTILTNGNTILLRFTETDKSICIYNTVSVKMYEKEKYLINNAVVHDSCKYILTRFELDYLGYVNNMLSVYGRFNVHKYTDKVEVTCENKKLSIYNRDKGVEIRNTNGKTVGNVEFTFNDVEDTGKLVGVILDGMDRSRQ